MLRFLPTSVGFVAFALALTSTGVASAQSDATAEILFRDGKKLLAEKKYDEACPKFAESIRIAPSSGVELALGLCYEAQGKTASAWGAFTAVISLARRDARRDREKVAATHAKALEGKLSRVTFTVNTATAGLVGFELREDGVALGRAGWADAPVDPGEHQVEAVAPGYVPYKTTITIAEPGAQTVTIPALGPLPPPPPPPPPPGPPPEAISWRKVGEITAEGGVGLVVIGAVFGGLALGDVGAAQKICPHSPCTNASAVSENNTGGTFADTSTALFILGGALVAGGATAYFLSPSKHAPPPAPLASYGAPVVGLGFFGWRGTF